MEEKKRKENKTNYKMFLQEWPIEKNVVLGQRIAP